MPTKTTRTGPRGLPAFSSAQSEASEGSEFFGGMIRELRKARGVTLANLAAIAGISIGHLSNIERGKSEPTVTVMHAIAQALGVTIGWFFRDAASQNEERDLVVRKAARRKLTFENGITDELLSPNLRGDLELLMARFPPGAESGDEPYTHRGEESGVILQGTLCMTVSGKTITLNEGDSFAFKSTEPHRYWNPSEGETLVIWAITPPSY